MQKLAVIFLSCAILVTQVLSYQFDKNTKYGKLQQKCIKNIDQESCNTIIFDCMAKKVGNACEAQYSIAIIYITAYVAAEVQSNDLKSFEIGAKMAKSAYEIGCKELKHKKTCEIDRYFLEKVMNNDLQVKKYIHGK